ncbi:MAG: hypothetical protein AAF467_14140 [Actinomycetota bacterium]
MSAIRRSSVLAGALSVALLCTVAAAVLSISGDRSPADDALSSRTETRGPSSSPGPDGGSDDDLRAVSEPATATVAGSSAGDLDEVEASSTSVTEPATTGATSTTGAPTTPSSITDTTATGPRTSETATETTTTTTTETTTTETATTEPTTTEPTTASTEAPSTGGMASCRRPSGGVSSVMDFAARRQSGASVDEFNQGSGFLRTVFALDPARMSWGADGLELAVDVGIAGPLDNRYRAELRERTIDQPIASGTTQMYCMRFRVGELPDLYGPIEIFQRFDRAVDGPDLGVELTGANQFSDAVPGDIQVVAFDGRHRTGVQLASTNTLMVVIHNHPSSGSYKVVLNGRLLRERSGINTMGSPGGTWSQFGIYPHGLYDDDGPNRQDQIDSGRTVVRFEYVDYEIVDYGSGVSDLGGFTVR